MSCFSHRGEESTSTPNIMITDKAGDLYTYWGLMTSLLRWVSDIDFDMMLCFFASEIFLFPYIIKVSMHFSLPLLPLLLDKDEKPNIYNEALDLV